MLLIRVFREINKSQGSRCKNLRFVSTKPEEKIVERTERKYLKPLSTQKLQPWRGCTLESIFTGNINKKIFEYPTVLTDEALDTVLSQSQAVENFFNLNKKSNITNEVIQKLRELELFGLSVPQSFGGAGYNETETKFLHECTGVNPTIARFIGYKEDFGCKILNQYGTEEQKKKYLPDLVKGKRLMTLAYLEREPIIDISKQETATLTDLENNKYILNGEKKWVHYADKADLFLVLAKLPCVDDEESELKLKFHLFLIEKNMPGVTVHKLKSEAANKANLFEISFKNVSVPFDNLLGGSASDGIDILKWALSHSHLTEATLCLSLMKHMYHDALEFVEEKNLKDLGVRGHLHVQENIIKFLIHIYALESVVYLLTGSYDMHEKVDLFNDSIMAKILAIDFLRTTIQMYTDILGRESFKNSGMIEEALETLQYYSVLDENIEHLKMMSAADGLVATSRNLAPKIKILKNPFDNPYDALKFKFKNNSDIKKSVSNLNLKMELHASLLTPADILEENIVRLHIIIQNLFLEKGNLAINSEHAVAQLAEVASYIFACIACLSRASSSVCYDVKNFLEESYMAHAFVKMMDLKIQKSFTEELMNFDLVEYFLHIGENAFFSKEYPMQHPLSRAF